jgi:hypothetical protein
MRRQLQIRIHGRTQRPARGRGDCPAPGIAGSGATALSLYHAVRKLSTPLGLLDATHVTRTSPASILNGRVLRPTRSAPRSTRAVERLLGARSDQRRVHFSAVEFAARRPAALVVIEGGEEPEPGTNLRFPGHNVNRAGERPDRVRREVAWAVDRQHVGRVEGTSAAAVVDDIALAALEK